MTTRSREAITTNDHNGATTDARIWWAIIGRAADLEVRRRNHGGWRMYCPRDDSHTVTLTYDLRGVALCCHGPAGAGHSLITHRRLRHGAASAPDSRPDLDDLAGLPWPCSFCGCGESMVLAALGVRARDKFRQPASEGETCTRRRCGRPAYAVGADRPVCLEHLVDALELDPGTFFS